MIRGLGAAGQQLPLALLDAAQALLERRLVGIPAAEMAEALSRHADQEPLARDFASAALASGSPIDASTACARWWLAERWAQIREAPLPVDPEQIREARLVVLSSEAVQNSRARAMAVEAVARSVDRLIVDTPDNLEAARSATMRRRTTELCCWRAVVATGAALLVMFNADTIVARIDSATGVPKPTAPVFQGIFGLGCAVVAFALVTLALELAKLYRGIEMPRVEQAAQVFVPLLAGLAGAILHQG